MKAVLYDARAKAAALSDVPVPEIADGEALIAVEACGLCGTDLLKLSSRPERAVLGHEVAGRVARLGRGVAGLKEGDLVVAAHHVPCLDCHYCRRGSHSMCRQFKATNFDPGGFCEYLRLSPRHVRHTTFKVPDGLDALSACQTEPLACCLRNVKRLGTRPGDVVGVVGLGAIGLMTAQLLKRAGTTVLGADLDATRAAALAPWGRGFTDAEALRAEAAKATDGRGLDALVFTAGTAALVAQRSSWVRDGGVVNVFASFHPAETALDLNEIYHRELTFMSSYSPSLEDLSESLDLIASRAVTVEPLRARTYALERFAEAERAVRDREILKAILVPR